METEDFFIRLKATEEGCQYLNLISKAKAENRGLIRESGFEIHHIQPRALGGGHEEGNRVKLTVYEHCLAHVLLAKAVSCYETLQPLTRMAGRQLRELSEVDKLAMGNLLEDFSNMRNTILHSRKPESTRLKIAEANRRKAANPEWRKSLHKPKSEETKQRMRKPKSEDHRKKLGEANRRRGQEYWEQKQRYIETGEVGKQLKALMQRSEAVRKINELKRQIIQQEGFQAWYEVNGYSTKGRRLNKLTCVPKYLKETHQRLKVENKQ